MRITNAASIYHAILFSPICELAVFNQFFHEFSQVTNKLVDSWTSTIYWQHIEAIDSSMSNHLPWILFWSILRWHIHWSPIICTHPLSSVLCSSTLCPSGSTHSAFANPTSYSHLPLNYHLLIHPPFIRFWCTHRLLTYSPPLALLPLARLRLTRLSLARHYP